MDHSDSAPGTILGSPTTLNPPSTIQPKLNRILPPNVLLRIFHLLPLCTLANVSLVSRRFKVLAYDDEIWDDKLDIMKRHESGTVTKSQSKDIGSLIGKENELMINHKPLNELIRGLKMDPYNARARAKSTGEAREQFKQVYDQLIPYYVDLRNRHSKESKILCDFGTAPVECGKTLNLLVGLGQVHVVEDWKEINEGVDALCQYFESASLHEFQVAYDSHNVDDMKTYAYSLVALNGGSICTQTFIQKHQIFYDNPFKPEDNFVSHENDLEPFNKFICAVSEELQQQAHIVSQVFPANVDVFYTFADRVFEDVISDYIGQLVGIAHNKGIKLYLHTTSLSLSLMASLVDTMTDPSLPSHLDKERGTNLLFKLLLPFLDDYLFEEQSYVNQVCEDGIDKWNNRPNAQQDEDNQRLTNQSRETFKRNYISAFKKVLALPVDLVSSAATTIASPFQRSSTLVKSQNGNGKQDDSTQQSTPPSTPRSSITKPRKIKTESVISQSSASPIKSPSTPTASSSRASSDGASINDPTDVLETAQAQLDMMQDLLSLELALQLIHLNKDSEKRVQRFIGIGFPGRMKHDIQTTYEQIFIRLLKALGSQHIKPGFERASSELLRYKPVLESGTKSDDLPPLTDFFELVHVADVIQQMVQLYYDEEMAPFIDKHDFMNDVNKEKKAFERTLDDCVAAGMDYGIQVLLSQVELILTGEQLPNDYNPQDDTVDLKPTKACLDVIQCLKSNTSMLHGAAEKTTMDLFFSEVGRRFFEVLSKHLKTQTVNEQGGIRYICDVNAYYEFVASLRQKTVTPYFSALKSLSNLYIIDSAPDIKSVIHDLERYHGLMRIEDLLEFASCRSDWPVIKKVVQKDMTDCIIM